MSHNLVQLNGVRLVPSKPTINAFTRAMPDNTDFELLRDELADEWFLQWRGGIVFGIPRIARPTLPFGTRTILSCADHPQFIAALSLDRLRRLLEQRAYRALKRRPFTFALDKGEIVEAILGKLRNPPKLLDRFKIFRKYELNTKLLEPREGENSIALVMSLGTKWEITASLDELGQAGINLHGLAVVRRSPEPGQRRLIGRIANLDGSRAALLEAYDGLTSIPISDVWLEGSRAAFVHCLRILLASNYDQFEAQRRLQEAEFLSPVAFDDWIERMASFLREKLSPLQLGGGLQMEIGERIEISNSPEYQSITVARPVEYCYDRARTKRSEYAWSGVESHGPFSPIMKRTPQIAVLFPNTLQGPTEHFIELLRRGVTSLKKSHYQKGFARTFDLVNPQFLLYPFPWVGRRDVPVSERYRVAVHDLVNGKAPLPDAAIVVIPDEYTRLRDADNPYLHAKASLLMAGIPMQSIRVSTLRQDAYTMQYSLQNFAVALCAKMGGIPWTVEQDLTVSDEIVIGLGSCELADSRFGSKHRFVGITTVFRGDGNYILSHLSDVCSYDEYPLRLRDSTVSVLEDVKRRNGWQRGDTVRIIVHSFKPLREVETAEIIGECVRAVGQEQKVRFAFATVSHEHDFAVFDPNQRGLPTNIENVRKGELVPNRGVIVEIGRNTRLLCATGPGLLKRVNAPLPRPILVSLHPSSDYDDRHYLTEQVLRFTALSWRSVLPAREPVTIAYSEMIARQLIRLREIPGWDIAVLNEKLNTSRWFL